MPDLNETLEKYTNKFNEAHTLCMGFLAGSKLYGCEMTNKSDMDIHGIYIEPAEKALGLNTEEGYDFSTGNQESRNSSEDVDIKFYTLRKWARLAANGNPTVLSYLFVPDNYSGSFSIKNFSGHLTWRNVRSNREIFIAKSHADAFLGYGHSQYQRFKGLIGLGKHGQRPELVAEFGYEVKAAYHMIRMMKEGIELMEKGTITFPSPHAELYKEIRRGEWSESLVSKYYLELEEGLKQAEANSQLPEEVHRPTISKLIMNSYLDCYEGRYNVED